MDDGQTVKVSKDRRKGTRDKSRFLAGSVGLGLASNSFIATVDREV